MPPTSNTRVWCNTASASCRDNGWPKLRWAKSSLPGGFGRTRPVRSEIATAHQDAALLLPNRVQLRGLGAALLRLRGRATGRAPSARRAERGAVLCDPSGGATARLEQHTKSGAV